MHNHFPFPTLALLPSFLLLQGTPPCQAQSQSAVGYQCEWNNDPCAYRMTNRCDVGGDDDLCPPQTDCYDCDPMKEFNHNCEACVEAGGFWCPRDARCQSRRLGQGFFSSITPIPFRNSCPNQDDWTQSCPTFNSTTSAAVFSDPLYQGMAWQYEMIRVEEVWRQGITGTGVRVRINDGGIDTNHNEVTVNLDRDNSCAGSFQPPQGDRDTTGYIHGTEVASILAGAPDNDQCAVGIAPGVSFSFCKKSLFNPLEDAKLLVTNLQSFDISSNSWGPSPCNQRLFDPHRRLQKCPFQFNEYSNTPCNICGNNINLDNENCKRSIINHCKAFYELDSAACSDYLDLFVTCNYHSLLPEVDEAMQQAVKRGRNGKGIVFVFPSGNEHGEGSFATFDGYVNSRYTIAVAGVDQQAKVASYSTRGSPVFIAAPAGDIRYVSNNVVAKYGGGCKDAGPGTSLATPIVSGVVALMLQVNPNLTWRDAQGVLAASAQHNDANDRSWTTNGAGIKHSYKYGFGLVDAAAAVDLSRSWTNWAPEEQIVVESGFVNVTIVDDKSETATSTVSLSMDDSSNFFTESVEVSLDLQHGSRGDLQINLISPSGTVSVLAVGKRPEDTVLSDGERWKLMTVRNWGESPVGEWKLRITDQKEGSLTEGCQDRTWLWYNIQTKEVVGCEKIEDAGACSNGEAVGLYKGTALILMVGTVDAVNYYNPMEACCACGGGTFHSAEPVLKSWNLVVHGHRPVATPAPTAAPTPASTPAPVGNNGGENNGDNEGNGDAASESVSRTAPVEWTESPTDIAEETMTVGPSEEASTVGPTGYENATFGPTSDEGIDESIEIPAEVSRSRSEGDASDKEGLEGDTPIRGADDLPFSSGNPILSQSFLSFVAGLFALCEILMPMLY